MYRFFSLLILFAFALPIFSTPATTKETKPRIIYETDMDWDFDDAAALSLLHALADNGETEILVGSDA